MVPCKNSKYIKVTTWGPQWSHLSCCSIPVRAPGDHSHLDQWSRSPRSCQSACTPHRTTRRWLKAEWGHKSVIAPRNSPRSDSFPLHTAHIFTYFLFTYGCWWRKLLFYLKSLWAVFDLYGYCSYILMTERPDQNAFTNKFMQQAILDMKVSDHHTVLFIACLC